MFETLTNKITDAVKALSGNKTLTEENTKGAVSQVRLALLDADVNFQVVKHFIAQVKQKVIGQEVVKSANAGQTFIKLLHDELVSLLDPSQTFTDEKDIKSLVNFDPKLLKLDQSFTSIMLCGLQASGKTTHIAKLAKFLKEYFPNKKILVAACDLQRPKAVEQLKILSEKAGVDFFPGHTDACASAKQAYKLAKEQYDVLLVDTAGRLYIDEELMKEAAAIKEIVHADRTLFVASAAMGQDVAKSAQAFDQQVGLDASIVSMLDSDAKAGAVLSIGWMTQKPILFEGTGERLEDLQLFNPRSMADRILGMGDTINLVRKLSEHVDEKQTENLKKKLLSASFSFDDYLKQIQMVKKMGSLSSLMKMIPGMSSLPIDEKGFKKTEAMILSMTPAERQQRVELSVERRRRIACGSGVDLHELNRMVKSFEQVKKMFKNMSGMKQLKKMFKGASIL